MAGMAEASVDAIVTDPPYGLASGPTTTLEEAQGGRGFMGKEWDRGVPGVTFWREALRVAKPGAHMLAFGGTRAFHRMAVAIEDAGWEIRDCVAWVYGSGFPKSLDASKAIDKRQDWSKVERLSAEIKRAREIAGFSLRDLGNAMQSSTNGQYGAWYHRGGHMFFETGRSLPSRPEWEQLRRVLPIAPEFQTAYDEAEREVLSQRPAYGIGSNGAAFNGHSDGAIAKITAPATDAAKEWAGWGTALKPAWEPVLLCRKPVEGTVAANLLKHGTGALNIDGCRIDTPKGWPPSKQYNAGFLAGGDKHTGVFQDIRNNPSRNLGRWPANFMHDGSPEVVAGFPESKDGVANPNSPGKGWHGQSVGGKAHSGYGGSGSAARFFYCAKASRADREEGCEGLPARSGADATDREEGTAGLNSPRAGASRTVETVRNHHPTVKPTELMRYLIRLITPPGGTVLDPFMGSGSTGKAAMLEGATFHGCDLDPDYLAIAEARIRFGLHLEAEEAAAAFEASRQLSLFGDL